MKEDAEKKKISKLVFDVDTSNLTNINTELKKIAKTSENLVNKINDNLSKAIKIDTNNIIDTKTLKSQVKKTGDEIEKVSDTTKNEILSNDKIYIRESQLQLEKHQQKMKEVEARRVTNNEKNNQQMLESSKTLYDKISEYAKTYLIYQGFNQLKNALIDTINEMVNVEAEMVAIQRVMEEGSIVVDEYRDKLIQLAYDYGNSFDNVADITLRLAQAGFDANESLALTEKTLLALNTADLDATEATSDMIAVMAQWGLMTGDAAQEAEDYGNIIDKINIVADRFPTTSADIMDALKKTSSAFNLAGATIDETIATIVAAEKASQRGGKAIGTALSNIIQQLKESSKIDIAESLGLNFYTDETKTEFKGIMEIFQEMSEKMQQLKNEGKESSVEMQNLLSIFTVFRRNIGSSLLGEMAGEDSTYAEVIKTLQQSIGYSINENTKYMQTAEAAQQQFNATLLKLKTEVWDEGVENVYKGLLNFGSNLVTGITEVSKKFGLLPSIVATATLALTAFKKQITDTKTFQKYSNQMKETSAAIDLFNDVTKKGEITNEEFIDILGSDLSTSFKKYISSVEEGEASLGGFIVKTALAKAGQLALNVAIAAGQAAISFGLSFALQAIIKLFQDWIVTQDEAGTALKEMNTNLSDNVSKLDEYTNKFQTLREEMKDTSLTQEELNKKKQELKNIEKELIEQYGKEAEGLDLVSGAIEEQTNKINNLIKTNYKKYIQENQKEINKLAKTFSKDMEKTLNLGDFWGNISDLEKIKEILTSIEGVSSPEGAAWVAIKGTPEEVLESYRNIYDKLTEYQNQNLNNMSDSDKKYLKDIITNTSSTISKLEDKYGEDLETYKAYLENKLQYDDFYKNEYEKILDAKAKVTEAYNKGDLEGLKQAQDNLSNVYNEAIDTASKDPNVADGMVKLLKEQIDNANKEIKKEELYLKLNIKLEDDSGKTIKDEIQNILDSMGDISLEDLKSSFDTNEITDNMQTLKDTLDSAGISVQDLLDNFDALGLTLGKTSEVTSNATDNLTYLKEQVDNSIESLASLDNGFTTVYNAMNEFNQNGYITASTLQTLINNDLLKYFDVLDGKLAINEAAMTNAATAAKAKAIQDLQAKAAAEIAAIAFDTESTAVSGAENTTAIMTEKTNNVKTALSNMTPEALAAADAWQKLNAAMGGSLEGLADDKVNQIQNVMNNLSKSITALNSVKIESVSYRRVSAQSSGGSGGTSSSAASTAEREAKKAAEEAEKAAEEAKKAAEELYKNNLAKFEDYVKEKERLEERWVKKQKELGQLSNKDYLYITEQRINRYKEYLAQVEKMTWLTDEDRLKLEKEYTEEIEDLQVDYLGYLKDVLDEEIDALEEANKEKIQMIEDEADARIAALKKVEDSTSRARDEEDYQKQRQEILDEIAYWEQRTGREATEALKESKEKLVELDDEWQRQLEDWSIEDQIAAIEAERDAQIQAIEDSQEAEIKAMQEAYDEKVKLYAETGNIIYEQSKIQSNNLYNAYKDNFVNPIMNDLQNIQNQIANTQTPKTESTTPTQTQQYETYTIQWGDTLSGIANKFGTTIEKIMAANPYVTNKNKIYAGKTLQIPKFHEGGEFGGIDEGLALLKRGEVILKPEWTEQMNRFMKYVKNTTNTQGQPISNNSKIEVNGNLVNIQATIKDENDMNKLTRKVEKMLKDKFNINK